METLTTKQALAKSLKQCMETKPFSKISVTNITDGCYLNRKSFYYHFQDKYDLLTWIFDSESQEYLSKKVYSCEWDTMVDLFTYLENNRKFYKKALKIEGQNSLQEHFHEFFFTAIEEHLKKTTGKKDLNAFYVQFFSDAFFCAMMRWLEQPNRVSPQEFIHKIEECMAIDMQPVTWMQSYNTSLLKEKTF